MGNLRRTVVVLGAMLAGVVTLPTAAAADGGAIESDFGSHVVTCEQTMGFDGQHNPGMHQGLVGWNPEHVC